MAPFTGPLSALGWRGGQAYDDGDVAALRRALDRDAGIPGLEVVDPAAAGFAERAAALFRRDGFVVIRDVLDAPRLAAIRRGCDAVVREMVGADPGRVGNRGSHRYSFGHAPAHFGRDAEWAALIDPPPLLAALRAIFGTDDFACPPNALSGGDFCLPGAVEFQHLHSDGSPRQDGRYLDVRLGRRRDGSEFWLPLRAEPEAGAEYRVVNYRELPCTHVPVTVNFPMELVDGSAVGHSRHNGATRQIPGTHHSRELIPQHAVEPAWMKMSMVAPAPAGCAVLRDNRAWHGGTPNLSRHIRAIPTATYFVPSRQQAGAGRHAGISAAGAPRPKYRLPDAVFRSLSADGQRICREFAHPDAGGRSETRWRQDWGWRHTERGFENTGGRPPVLPKL